MFQQNKTKILGVGATPMFLNGMPFYIQMDVPPIRSEDRSSQLRKYENEELNTSSPYKHLIGIDLLIKLCDDQDWLIREQDTQIQELQTRLSDYEQETYEKDQIIQLEAELRSRSNCIEEANRGGYQ
jgi:hypothetical protein